MSWDDFDTDVRGSSNPRRERCGMALLLESLTPEQAAVVQTVMDDAATSSRAIRLALVKRVTGDVPSIWTINRHRRQDCLCNAGRGYNS